VSDDGAGARGASEGSGIAGMRERAHLLGGTLRAGDAPGGGFAVVADPGLDGVRVLVLTTFDEDEHVFAAIRAGASGYLLKDVAPPDLRAAIRTVAAGDSLLSPAVTATVLRAVAEAPGGADERLAGQVAALTEREREVLRQVGRGLTNDEIARELYLSPATARTYVSRLLAKLDARDRAALIVLAYETGLVTPGG
jgi:DNA-binding NarL/FixJ family response regulator